MVWTQVLYIIGQTLNHLSHNLSLMLIYETNQILLKTQVSSF